MKIDPILVTGATGYVGGRLIPALLEAGYPVRAMARNLEKMGCRPWAGNPRVQLVQGDVLDLESLNRAQDTGVRSARSLVQMLTSREWISKPQVFFLTRGTMPVVKGDDISGLASAPITGLLRVANNEHADYCWTQVDLDSIPNTFEIEDLTNEILLSDCEHEVAYRNGERYARRVHRAQ